MQTPNIDEEQNAIDAMEAAICRGESGESDWVGCPGNWYD